MEPTILHNSSNTGWIEVICGSMFSGKTEELIRRMKRARIAKQRVEIFKPAMDTRYDDADVVSHDESVITSTPVSSPSQILLLTSDATVIGIDEGQFFDETLVEVVTQLARDGRRVIVAGLDQDYLGQPFEPMPQLMAVAEYVTKLHAICVICGAPANHSQRLTSGDTRLLLGATESYEPRCRRCFSIHPEADIPHDAVGNEPARTPDAGM
ncbi:MAG: thymidine kinase [Rhodothermales bacterium]|nr:thymidine kinase [Rhodothermales bacterium]